MKIILDTNLWISYLITNNLKRIDELLRNDKVTILFSKESLEEFIEVVDRPKFEKHFSREDIASLLFLFDLYSKIIDIKSDVQVCRDSKDNFLLNLAIDGRADYLITGDKDLLILEQIDQTSIITYREFLAKVC